MVGHPRLPKYQARTESH